MKILIVSKANCTECERIKTAMLVKDMDYEEERMDLASVERQFELKNIARRNRQLSMPMLFIDNEFIRTSEFEEKYIWGGN